MSTMPTQPQPLPPVSSGGEHRLRSENLAFDIDVWYPPLAEHTFHTVFLPLSRMDAQAIVAYYNRVHRHVDEGIANFTDTVVQRLIGLEERIDNALPETSQFSENGGAFLRLCGRSPKDGEPTDPCLRSKIWRSYCKALEDLKEQQQENMDQNRQREAPATAEDDTQQDEEDGNARVAAISHSLSYLRVKSGSEAMALLLTSERVFSDMLDWIHYGEPEQIVLRTFCDSFDLSSEFRCYIQPGGILCGISQYDTYAKYAFLQDRKHRTIIVQAVVGEWLKIRDCIQTIDGSYCVDFGVDMKRGRARLIELSPFRRCTGPALFAWKQNENGARFKLLFPARSDVQDDRIPSLLASVGHDDQLTRFISPNAIFRVRSQAIPRIGELVEMNWDHRWSPDRMDTPKPYRDMYALAQNTKPKVSLLSQFRAWLSQGTEEIEYALEQEQPILFVYGTLKKNCHWHSKYMTEACFLGEGVTVEPQPLVIGACGVPYLMQTLSFDHQAKGVKGELWRISSEMLQRIDEYEGIHKGHYTRKEIYVATFGTVVPPNAQKTRRAFCYFYAIKPGESDIEASLLSARRISEYTAEEQKELYKPIHHIQVKQLQYLGEEATT